ncbi:hypothetical protein [Streptomyces sp. NPDC055005]
MNVRLPDGGDTTSLPALLLAAAVAVLAAQSEAWASALGTATAVYSVIVTGNQDRRN